MNEPPLLRKGGSQKGWPSYLTSWNLEMAFMY